MTIILWGCRGTIQLSLHTLAWCCTNCGPAAQPTISFFLLCECQAMLPLSYTDIYTNLQYKNLLYSRVVDFQIQKEELYFKARKPHIFGKSTFCKQEQINSQCRMGWVWKETWISTSSEYICGCSSTLTWHHALGAGASPCSPQCLVLGYCHSIPRHSRAVQGQPINLQLGFPDIC